MSKILDDLFKKYNKKVIDILGTEYLINICSYKEDDELKECYGYCSKHEHIIVVVKDGKGYIGKSDTYVFNAIKRTLRHEILHAFLDESGLLGNAMTFKGPWPINEEMVDWFALQSPKIFKIYNDLDLLDFKISWKKEKVNECKKAR